MGVKFRRQHGIGNYIVDFCCSSNKLVVEIDGSEHLDTDNYDQNRTIYLNNLGYKVLRFWNNEINKNLNGVIIKIAENLANKK